MDDTTTALTTRTRDSPQEAEGDDDKTDIDIVPAGASGTAVLSLASTPVASLAAEPQGFTAPIQKSESVSEPSIKTLRRSERLSLRVDEVIPVTNLQNQHTGSSSTNNTVHSQPSSSHKTEMVPAPEATKAVAVRPTRRSARHATTDSQMYHASSSSTTQTVPPYRDGGAPPKQVTRATTVGLARRRVRDATVEPRVQRPSSSSTVRAVIPSQSSTSNGGETVPPPAQGTRATTVRPTRRSTRHITVPQVQHAISSSTVSQPEVANETEAIASPEQANRATLILPIRRRTNNITVEPRTQQDSSSSTAQTVPSHPATSNETEAVTPPEQGTRTTTVQPARRSTRNATVEKTQMSERGRRPPGPQHLEAALDIAVRNLKSDVWGYLYAYLKKIPEGLPTIDEMKRESRSVRKAADDVDKADRELQDAIEEIMLSNSNQKGRKTERSAKPVESSAVVPDSKPESSGFDPDGADNDDSTGSAPE